MKVGLDTNLSWILHALRCALFMLKSKADQWINQFCPPVFLPVLQMPCLSLENYSRGRKWDVKPCLARQVKCAQGNAAGQWWNQKEITSFLICRLHYLCFDFCIGSWNYVTQRDQIRKKEACSTYCSRIREWRLFPWLGNCVAAVQKVRFAVKYRSEAIFFLPVLFWVSQQILVLLS